MPAINQFPQLKTPDGASNINVIASGANATVRDVQDKLRDVINVKDYGAVGNGLVNDTVAIQRAVAAAYAVNAMLRWAPGTYVTTASIPNLHNVLHIGTAVIARGSTLFQVANTRGSGFTNTIYVNLAGNDLNDGLGASQPVATLAQAFTILTRWGSSGLPGSWVVQCAAGNVGPLSISDLRSDSRIDVIGVTAGHPNVPTTTIDGGGAGGRAINIDGLMNVRFTDISISNYPTGTAVVVNRSRVNLNNVHITNCLNGVTNLNGGFVRAIGGIWNGNNLGGDGYETFYNAIHDFIQTSADPAVHALTIRNFGRGMLINEGGQGHIDYVNITDCATAGINIKRGAGAINTNGVVLKRNAVGVLVENNAWYNNGIDFGSGVDANTVPVQTRGVSPELLYATDDTFSRNVLQNQVTGVSTHTGTTANTLLWESANIPDWVFSTQSGHVHKVRVFGTFTAPAVGTATLRVEMYNQTTSALCGEAVLPIGTTIYDLECVTYKDTVNTHQAFTRCFINGGTPLLSYRSFGLDVVDVECSIRVFCELSSAGDQISRKVILESTHAG